MIFLTAFCNNRIIFYATHFASYLSKVVFVFEELDRFCGGTFVPAEDDVLTSGRKIVRFDGMYLNARQMVAMLCRCYALT